MTASDAPPTAPQRRVPVADVAFPTAGTPQLQGCPDRRLSVSQARRHGERLDAVGVTVRPTKLHEGLTLQEIEMLAGRRFREVGLDDVAHHEPPTVDALAGYAAAGRSWVASDDADEPVGFVLVDVVDGHAHVEQLSVRPDHQGQGVGRALLDCVGAWALDNEMSMITLTTFAHIDWNRPLFEHLGFRLLRDEEIGPGLREVRRAETARGLDPWLRACMARPLATECPTTEHVRKD